MQNAYKVELITAPDIDRAYSLVSRAVPSLTLCAWRKFCSACWQPDKHHAGQENVVIATNPLGYVQGVYVSGLRRDRMHGRILDASIFAVASAADEAGVATALFAHLRALAKAESCKTIRVWALGHPDWSRYLADESVDHSGHGLLIVLDI
jgi:hypothetical protein